MKCYICDATLSPEGIKFNHDHKEFDPCGTCLIEISEVFGDHLDEDEITWLLDSEDPVVQEEIEVNQGDEEEFT